jgi:hypothetical protein
MQLYYLQLSVCATAMDRAGVIDGIAAPASIARKNEAASGFSVVSIPTYRLTYAGLFAHGFSGEKGGPKAARDAALVYAIVSRNLVLKFSRPMPQPNIDGIVESESDRRHPKFL